MQGLKRVPLQRGDVNVIFPDHRCQDQKRRQHQWVKAGSSARNPVKDHLHAFIFVGCPAENRRDQHFQGGFRAAAFCSSSDGTSLSSKKSLHDLFIEFGDLLNHPARASSAFGFILALPGSPFRSVQNP
jgi:hypothetical protein